MSPVSGLDIPGGDVAHTEALLARPPEGVTYTTYNDALADGPSASAAAGRSTAP